MSIESTKWLTIVGSYIAKLICKAGQEHHYAGCHHSHVQWCSPKPFLHPPNPIPWLCSYPRRVRYKLHHVLMGTGASIGGSSGYTAIAGECFFPIKLHLCFLGAGAATGAGETGFTLTGGLSHTGASPSLRVVLVCRRSKTSFSRK